MVRWHFGLVIVNSAKLVVLVWKKMMKLILPVISHSGRGIAISVMTLSDLSSKFGLGNAARVHRPLSIW
jgi:uncharacterized membrane protein YhhN